ncbi:MAG: gliding motility-associated C-terminal domain-containing protein, partial [Cytophagales bacterium]|nr:gliding motility-associated C-terminal domain-containing protein [Cytophagales bacterium]
TGIPLQVITSPSNSVKWTPSTGLSNPLSATTNYFGTVNQTYDIIVSDLNNCTLGGTVKVTAKNKIPIPDFDIYSLPDSLPGTGSACAPHAIFTEDKSQFADLVQWKWKNSQAINTSGITTNFTSPGNYPIKLIAVNATCNLKDSLSKNIRIKVPQVIFPPDTQVCVGSQVQLTVKSNSLKSIDWQPNINITDPAIPNPIVWANGPLGYLITFEDTNSCIATDTVLVSNFPITEPSLPKYLPFCKKLTPTVSLNPGNYKTYIWSAKASTVPILVVDTAGLYKVSLRDFNNCSYSDSSQVVEFCAPVVFAPSAFSPNGDGKNDQFEVFGSFVTRFEINIYNRWGELIYHSDDFHFKWDGKFRGLDVPISAYPYVIYYEGK